ncbi:MAG: hypothetical protein WEA09_14570 [Gemmatimonadota bacterium]
MEIASQDLLRQDPTALASRRRWRIPPPVTRDPEAPGPEGLSVLPEHPGEEGLLLWLTLRNVLLWSRVPPSSRKGLFTPEAMERRLALILEMHLPPRLHEPLTLLAGLLDRPHRIDPALVGLSCLRIHDWARDEGFPTTSLEFLQAASVACPGDGRYALAVGRELRERNLHGRAEAWFLRAIGLTRQARDWEAYTLTYITYGNMMVRRGNYPLARRLLTKAVRRAVRQGLKEPRARAHHDLFVVEAECGDDTAAQRHAQQALYSYPTGHPSLPALAHDVAYFWVERGRFAQALPVLERAMPWVPDTQASACFGALARTRGALGDRQGFSEAVRLLRGQENTYGVARAWGDVAHGALSLGLDREGEIAATQSLEMARLAGEGKVSLQAESLVAAARALRSSHEETQSSPHPPHVAEWDAEDVQMAETLAGEFVSSLASVL